MSDSIQMETIMEKADSASLSNFYKKFYKIEDGQLIYPPYEELPILGFRNSTLNIRSV